MMFPLVRDLAAVGVPVVVACRVLGFSKQAFYQWVANPVSARDWQEAFLLSAAYDIHADDPGFGHRFIADELCAAGCHVSERRVCSDRWAGSVLQAIMPRWRASSPRYGTTCSTSAALVA